MTPEEYQRIKEAEKEHLRALKKLKEKLREVERQKSISQALNNIADAPGDDIVQTHEEMIDRLAMDTIKQEARLEIALSDSEASAPEIEEEPIEELEASDAELQRLRAQELVRQIKVQMGMPGARRKPSVEPALEREETSPSEDAEVGDDVNPTGPGALPDKTIGRIRKKKS